MSTYTCIHTRPRGVRLDLRARREPSITLWKCRSSGKIGDTASNMSTIQPCDRLPCDRRCEKTVACGHVCTSCKLTVGSNSVAAELELFPVCGEECPQKCLDCFVKDKPQEIVDLIMQRSAEDLSKENDYSSIDNIVLELPCGHHLTVESADGIAELESFYKQDESGKWIAPTAPPKSVGGPKCPSCRKPFFLKRYGRVFKKADLDLSERSLVSSANRLLQDLHRKFQSLPEVETVERTISSVEDIDYSTQYSQTVATVNEAMKRAQVEVKPVDIAGLFGDVTSTFGFGKDDWDAWKRLAADEVALCNLLNSVIRQTSPQQEAWDSSYASLFRAEMNTGKCREEGAIRLAQRALGIPRPIGKQQYSLQATCLSIRVRHRLAGIAGNLRDSSSDGNAKALWRLLTTTLLTSTVVDSIVIRKDAIAAQLDRSYYVASHLCQSRPSNHSFQR
jgi:hypothetical protein